MPRLVRCPQNPLLMPGNNLWEDKLVFNPAAIIHDSLIYLFYRAMGTYDSVSRFGMAISVDGINFTRFSTPCYGGGSNSYDALGVEDPRVVKIDGLFYFVYTAVREDKAPRADQKSADNIIRIPQVAASTTKDFVNFKNHGVLIDAPGKDASLFPKKINGDFWLLYREGENKTYFTKSNDFKTWELKKFVFDKRPGSWDSIRVGVGGPPIETDKGWLLFYHGVDEKKVYRLGIIFLDLEDPTKVLYRSQDPIFEPEESYEMNGLIPHVVFTCGTVEKNEAYYVYYGGADKAIGLATIKKSEVLSLF